MENGKRNIRIDCHNHLLVRSILSVGFLDAINSLAEGQVEQPEAIDAEVLASMSPPTDPAELVDFILVRIDSTDEQVHKVLLALARKHPMFESYKKLMLTGAVDVTDQANAKSPTATTGMETVEMVEQEVVQETEIKDVKPPEIETKNVEGTTPQHETEIKDVTPPKNEIKIPSDIVNYILDHKDTVDDLDPLIELAKTHQRFQDFINHRKSDQFDDADVWEFGDNDAGSDLADLCAFLSKSNPPETDPAKGNPPETDLPKTNPPETDPAKGNPPETDPAKSNPPETVLPKGNPPESELPKSNPPETVLPKGNPPESELPKSNPPEKTEKTSCRLVAKTSTGEKRSFQDSVKSSRRQRASSKSHSQSDHGSPNVKQTRPLDDTTGTKLTQQHKTPTPSLAKQGKSAEAKRASKSKAKETKVSKEKKMKKTHDKEPKTSTSSSKKAKKVADEKTEQPSPNKKVHKTKARTNMCLTVN